MMCHKPVFHYKTSSAHQQGVQEMQPLPDLLRTPCLQGLTAVGTLILNFIHRAISHLTVIHHLPSSWEPPAAALFLWPKILAPQAIFVSSSSFFSYTLIFNKTPRTATSLSGGATFFTFTFHFIFSDNPIIIE